MIQIEDLTFRYGPGQDPALNHLDLTIRAGEYVAIIGPNGCGKTTLIRHLNALLLPGEGKIRINGLTTSAVQDRKEIRRLVGMIFQSPDNQIVGMTVEEDVAFGPGNLGLPATELRRRVDSALATVGLTGLEERAPYSLSGGQKQLLALAGILAMNPKVIVLDEPTASLDPAAKKVVYDLLRQLHRAGITIIHVTQDMDEAVLAQRVLVMNQGRIAADGPPREVLTRVEWLQGLGLDAPRLTQLLIYLQEAGLEVDAGSFDIAAAGRAILNAVEDGGGRSTFFSLRRAGSNE